MLRSAPAGGAAISLVEFRPTSEGRVCDIQLVIMAMVLSTTPIFSKANDIFARLSSSSNPSLYALQRGTNLQPSVAHQSLVVHLSPGWVHSRCGHDRWSFPMLWTQCCCADARCSGLLTPVRSPRLLPSNNENCGDSAELLIGPLPTPTAHLIKYSWGSPTIRVFFHALHTVYSNIYRWTWHSECFEAF